jgi:signal transduction histidine kinase
MARDEDLTFPDGFRSDLDSALTDLIKQAERVQISQGRLRALLRGVQQVFGEIELRGVLRNVVDAAVDLVQADYGALGVISVDGTELDQFIFTGIDEASAHKIGDPPRGAGLLGALISEQHHIRIPHLGQDPRAVGFPDHHPPMESFLGVPIRVRGEVFGNLYLTNRTSTAFSPEDEQLVEALASTAGVAIQNARLFEEARLREAWTNASAELSSALLSAPLDESLDLIAVRVFDVAESSRVTVLVPTDDERGFQIAAVRGLDDEDLLGATFKCASDGVRAAVDGEGAQIGRVRGDGSSDPSRIDVDGQVGPTLAIPLRSQQRTWGVLTLARRPAEPEYTSLDASVANRLATQVSIALELAHARVEQQRRMLSDERSRIAQDLHDHVIQQLFAAGLTLQAVAGGMSRRADQARLSEVAHQMDDAITQIRTVIFALSDREGRSVRHKMIDVVAELSSLVDRPPTVRFKGAVDHLVSGALTEDAVAVARELVTNSIRHTDADDIRLEVAVTESALVVTVRDNGPGITSDRRSGLRNLAQRADAHGGSFQVRSTTEGTHAVWQVPLSNEQEPRT